MDEKRGNDDHIEDGEETEEDDDDDEDDEEVARYKRILRVEVQDSGPGISAANQARLFDEIIQFDPNKLQGGQGSGLGLFISKGIMDLHGGRIGVSSQGEGCGACFFIEIPIIEEPPTGVVPLLSNADNKNVTPINEKMKVKRRKKNRRDIRGDRLKESPPIEADVYHPSAAPPSLSTTTHQRRPDNKKAPLLRRHQSYRLCHPTSRLRPLRQLLSLRRKPLLGRVSGWLARRKAFNDLRQSCTFAKS
jgi:hypothetical protein